MNICLDFDPYSDDTLICVLQANPIIFFCGNLCNKLVRSSLDASSPRCTFEGKSQGPYLRHFIFFVAYELAQ
jgi:hypothetical protein